MGYDHCVQEQEFMNHSCLALVSRYFGVSDSGVWYNAKLVQLWSVCLG